MPFNRNPKWFGLTQAQERKKGIDATKGIGIPIGRDLTRQPIDGDGDREKPTITSAEMFEELLGDGANQDLGRGLQGMFIAQ